MFSLFVSEASGTYLENFRGETRYKALFKCPVYFVYVTPLFGVFSRNSEQTDEQIIENFCGILAQPIHQCKIKL